MYELTIPMNTIHVTKVQSWIMEALDHKPLSSDKHFFDRLTLGEYLALSDEDEASLWDKWEITPLYNMNEVEVMKKLWQRRKFQIQSESKQQRSSNSSI